MNRERGAEHDRPNAIMSEAAASRVILGLHYLSDVLVGMAIGMAIGVGAFAWPGL